MLERNISCAVCSEKQKPYNVILANKWLLIDTELLIRLYVVEIVADTDGGAILGLGLGPFDLEFEIL
jgi:hypothetical protein